MIKVFIIGKGYTIQYNGKTIVKCNEALVPFKELLQHLGYDLSTVKVEIHDGEGAENVEVESASSEDDIIASMNETFVSPNLGKYRTTFENDYVQNPAPEQKTQKQNPESSQKHEPVGAVECPVEGDLIYVDGIQGVLSTITGGVGTVMTIYHSNDTIDVDTDDREDWDEDEDDDCQYEQYQENNILVELEEVPGHYFSWSLLRSQQSSLKTKYGYKPVCKL